jgi:hypothetical protein
MTGTGFEPLSHLVGTPLGAITFVRDYVQLGFDGPVLTAHSHPVVVQDNALFKWDDCGYRDALCRRIGATVISAAVTNDEQIRIEFTDRAVISISVRMGDYTGPEAAVLWAEPHLIVVW